LSKLAASICPGIGTGVPLNGDRPPPPPTPPPPLLATVKDKPLLGTPAIVATTLPVLAPAGTAATMLVADHEVGAAATPLNDTVLAIGEAPRFAPVMVTIVPGAPLDGDRLERFGPVEAAPEKRPQQNTGCKRRTCCTPATRRSRSLRQSQKSCSW